MTNRLGWNDLFMSGSIVDLTTSIWRARIGLKAVDLGIEYSEDVQKALSLGSHRLAPAKAFERIMEPSRAAARAIDYYSLNFGLIRGARYVPDANLPKLLEQLRKYKQDFAAAVDDFVAGYDDMKATMLPIIEKAMIDAAKHPDAAARAFERVQAEYPSAEAVRGKFKLAWSIYAVQGAKSKVAAEAAADETDTIKDVVRDMVTQLRGDMQEKLADVLDLINKGGKLQERSIESALAVLDRVDSLNILGDEVLSDQVGALRSALQTVDRGKRVSDDFVVSLEGIKKTLEASVEEAVAAAEQNLTGLGRRKIEV